MSIEVEEALVTLTYDWSSGEGKAHINANLFSKEQVIRIDMLQDWIASLEAVLETVRNATAFEDEVARLKAKEKEVR